MTGTNASLNTSSQCPKALHWLAVVVPPTVASVSVALFFASAMITTYDIAKSSAYERARTRLTAKFFNTSRLKRKTREAYREESDRERLKPIAERYSKVPKVFGLQPGPFARIVLGASFVIGLITGHISLSVLPGRKAHYFGSFLLTCLYGGLGILLIFTNLIMRFMPTPMGSGLVAGALLGLPFISIAMHIQDVRPVLKRSVVFTIITTTACFLTSCLVDWFFSFLVS